MSGSSSAARSIQVAAAARHNDIRNAVKIYGLARGTLAEQPEDVTDVMRCTPALIMAAEALESAAGEAVRGLRAVLAQQMAETGCTTIHTASHVVSSVTPSRRTFVSDRALIPQRFFVPQPPVPDMAAIKAEIARGSDVPGIGQTNGGPPGLRIASRKDITP